MIFVDTNVLSELMRLQPDARVAAWFMRNDGSIAVSAIVLGELAFGIERIRPAERAPRLERALTELRQRYAGRIFPYDEPAAIAFGALFGEAKRRGRVFSAVDGMIAATAIRHASPFSTRNVRDFAGLGLDLINPWD